jgi:hypothetical protein
MSGVKVERYAITPECTHEEFIAAAKCYARDVVERHGLTASVRSLSWAVAGEAASWGGPLP